MFLIKDGKDLYNLLKEDEKKTQCILPELVYRLIRAECSRNTSTHFPIGSATFTPGVDGYTRGVTEKHMFVPKGDAVWEIGSNKDSIGKIKKDYADRKTKPTITRKKLKTYVAVAGSLLDSSKKQALEESLSKEKIFKRVIIIDGNDLAAWLAVHFEVSIWLLKTYGRKINQYGAALLRDEWNYITKVTEPNLTHHIFLSGNESCSDKFITDLKTKDDSSFSFSSLYFGRDHAYFFVVASLIATEDDFLRERCITVFDQDTLFSICNTCENKILLVKCNFDAYHLPITTKNTIIFFDSPLFSSTKLELADRDNFRKCLTEIGLSNEEADTKSFVSGYNPVVLRRLLSNVPNIKAPLWARNENKNKLIPLMLLGEVNMDNQISVELLKAVVGDNYDDYLLSINYLSEMDDPPVFKYEHIYRINCRFEVFNYVQVDTYLLSVKKLENTLSDLIIKPEAEKSLAIINRAIQGFILLSEKNDNNQYHFDRYVSNVLKNIINKSEETNNIAPFLSLLAELSPTAFLYYLSESFSKHKDYLIQFASGEKPSSYYNSTKSDYIISALRSCMQDKRYAYESLNYLLDLYFEIDSSENVGKEIKNVLSPVSSMAGIVAIPYTKTIDIFFQYISDKNSKKSEPLVRFVNASGTEMVYSFHSNSFRNVKTEKYPCTYKDVADAHNKAFEWLLMNGKDKGNYISDIFHNIHHQPFNQMKIQFVKVIKKVGSLSRGEKETIRLKAIETKGYILRYSSWEKLKEYLPLLEDLIKATEPTDLFDKYRYILTNDFFPLDNPPPFDDSDHLDKESELRNAIRKDIANKLFSSYGQNVVSKIIKECGDNVGSMWINIYSLSDNHIRDVDEMISSKCSRGLKYYFDLLDLDTIKSIIDGYADQEVVFASLPLKKEILPLVKGKHNEKYFWKNNYLFRNANVSLLDVFDSYLEFDPIKLLDEFAFSIDFSYEQGKKLLERVISVIDDDNYVGKLKEHQYEIQTIVNKMDSRYYTTELAQIEFKLLPILLGGLEDYPLGIKKYIWDNPAMFSSLLLSLHSDNKSLKKDSLGFKIYFDALYPLNDSCFIPKEYLVQQSNKVKWWVDEMLSKCDFTNNESGSRFVIQAIVSILAACPKMPGQEIWPVIEVADSLENITHASNSKAKQIASSFSMNVNNRRGIRTVTNGEPELLLKNEYQNYATKYETTHPVTSLALNMIADDYEFTAKHDKKHYDLGEFD